MSDRLYTPWRMEYINEGNPPGCVLCNAGAGDNDDRSLVVHRGKSCFVLMNLFPYNPGHVMVTPYKHGADLALLESDTRDELFALATLATSAIGESMTPDGFNLGMNLGRPAGTGIADHLHLHVVPRWGGDTNFMPVLADTKVLPETIPTTLRKLRPIFARLAR